MSITVIIPSRTVGNARICVAAVLNREPALRIILVDDGLEGTVKGVEVIPGIKPFIFSRNCNLGIVTANEDDVVLLNDDALLASTLGFTQMQEAAEQHPEYGVISATTNVAGNPAQQRWDVGLRESRNAVAFVCVFIPRTTINKIGWLDERFTAYGWEDNDYCRRVREAGLKVGIFDGCFVDHASLKSTFRGDPRAAGDIAPGREIYLEKWGDLT